MSLNPFALLAPGAAGISPVHVFAGNAPDMATQVERDRAATVALFPDARLVGFEVAGAGAGALWETAIYIDRDGTLAPTMPLLSDVVFNFAEGSGDRLTLTTAVARVLSEAGALDLELIGIEETGAGAGARFMAGLAFAQEGTVPPPNGGNGSLGSGMVAWGADAIGLGAAAPYRLPPWNEAITATTAAFNWQSGCDVTLSCLTVRHNVPGVGSDITYEVFVGGVATGVTVVVPAASSVGTNVAGSVFVPAGSDVELRAIHGGLTTSPTRIVATMIMGAGAFGDSYQRVESPAIFTFGAGLPSPTAFVVKPGAVLVTPALTGDFRISWESIVNASAANVDTGVRLFNVTDAVQLGATQVFEPTSSSSEMEDMGASHVVTFTGAPKTFQIEVQKESGPNPGFVSISDAVLELWRVGP